MSDNLTVELTPAQVSIVRQALRAERDRMVKQGYANLAYVADETTTVISNALLDKNLAGA